MADQISTASLDLSKLRTDYQKRSLTEAEVDPDPLRQFTVWMNEAVAADVHEPTAMTLATCTSDRLPSARIVLLKGVEDGRFVFFTNYLSRKGRELDENPKAALVFFWPELERQVRITGDVTLTSAAESDAYFASRPPASRIGAVASAQSEPIASREILEQRVRGLQSRFPDGNISRPAGWGGYCVKPVQIEFWQGRPSRLHDRIEYLLDASGKWAIRRLAP